MSSKLKFLFISIVFILFLLLFNTNVFAAFEISNTVSVPDTVVLNEETIDLRTTDKPFTILNCQYGIGGTTYTTNIGYILIINPNYNKESANFSITNVSGSGQLAKIYCFNNSTSNLKNNNYYTYDSSSNSWVHYTTNTEDLNIRYDKTYTFYYSNVDIYKAFGYNKNEYEHKLPRFFY